MQCDCACAANLVHLTAEVAALTKRLERIERDIARESVDRQADVRLLRRNAEDMVDAFARGKG